MSKFIFTIFLDFFVAMGVVIGGSFFGALISLLLGQPPIHTLRVLAEQLKIWGLVAALGGTFDSFRILESGVFEGEINILIKQILYIGSAILGAHIAYLLIQWLIEGEIK